MKKRNLMKKVSEPLAKILFCFDTEDRKKLLLVLLLACVGALLETIVTGIVFPFMGIMTKPESIHEYRLLNTLYKYFGEPSINHLLVYFSVFLVGLYLFKTVFQFFVMVLQTRFSSRIEADIAIRLFRTYLAAPYHFFQNTNSSVLIRNITKEVPYMVGQVILSGMTFITEFVVVLGIFILLLVIEPVGFFFQTITIAILSSIYFLYFRSTIQKSSIVRQEADALVNKSVYQAFHGIKDVKVLGKEDFFIKEFGKVIRKLTHATGTQAMIFMSPRSFLEASGVLGLIAGIAAMAAMGYSKEAMLQNLAVIVASAFRLIPSFSRMMSNINQIKFGLASLNLIYEDLSTSYSSKQLSKNEQVLFPSPINLISFDKVEFSYPNTDKKVLKGIDLNVPRSQSIAIVGSSGAGKTTIIDLLLGLHKPTAGALMFDGIRLTDDNLDNWRTKIGFVPQHIYLHDDNIKRNIAFGLPDDQICELKLRKAIELAQLERFIDGLPEGVETLVGEEGVRLSGGQRQRLGIARAIYHEPEILIMDEATSALDNQTEKEFVEALEKFMGKKTLIIVAHRLTTIRNCDQIYFLKDGYVADSGTYESLSSSNQDFRAYAALL